ncbi:MAG: T9SS type A sorting domain-containing protein [Bacteroidia bacterium]|jgi:hypothetical protein|nr:T9SS type A sorting domain-containing protein [Bacteroidia bacterium]
MKTKVISILLTAVFAYANVRGQDFQFAKRVSGNQPAVFPLGNNYVLVNIFNDSCQFDTMPVAYKGIGEFSINSQVTVFTKQGAILSHFTLNGVTSFPDGLAIGQQVLNDSEWVMGTSMNVPIYSNGLLQVDSVTNSNELIAFSKRLVAVSVSGSVRLLIDLPVNSTGAISTVPITQSNKNNRPFSYCVDTSTQRLYALFNCAYPIDSQLINPQNFEKDKAIVLQINLATKAITNSWKLPVEFDRMTVVGGKLILAGRSLQLNHEFTIQNQTYTRDSLNDELTSDLVWGAFNPSTSSWDWHHHYKLKMKDKSNSGYFTLANTSNRLAIVCWYNDTITVNGTLYGEAIPFLIKPHFAMISTNVNGGEVWVNTFDAITNLTDFYSKGSDFCLNFYVYDQVAYMNDQLLPKTRIGENYIKVAGQTGALKGSFNYAFIPNWERKIDGIDITEDSIQFAIVSLFGLPNDTLVLLDKPYYLKDPLALWSEYVLVAFKATSQSFPTQMHERAFIEHRPVKAYPNPVTNQLYLHGFADEQESIITVVNVQGRVVLERTQPFGQAINTSTWEKGLYLVMVQTGPNRQVCRVMKE